MILRAIYRKRHQNAPFAPFFEFPPLKTHFFTSRPNLSPPSHHHQTTTAMPTIQEIIAAKPPATIKPPPPMPPMPLQTLNRNTPPPLPAVIVVAEPFGKNGRWVAVRCVACLRVHIHGDIPLGFYSKREAVCSALAYWIHNPQPNPTGTD